MTKKAISVTLDRENLLWLRAQAASQGCRSLSQMLDRLIAEARKSRTRPPQSVVGTVRIAESDSDLSEADATLITLFTL